MIVEMATVRYSLPCHFCQARRTPPRRIRAAASDARAPAIAVHGVKLRSLAAPEAGSACAGAGGCRVSSADATWPRGVGVDGTAVAVDAAWVGVSVAF